MNVEIKLV